MLTMLAASSALCDNGGAVCETEASTSLLQKEFAIKVNTIDPGIDTTHAMTEAMTGHDDGHEVKVGSDGLDSAEMNLDPINPGIDTTHIIDPLQQDGAGLPGDSSGPPLQQDDEGSLPNWDSSGNPCSGLNEHGEQRPALIQDVMCPSASSVPAPLPAPAKACPCRACGCQNMWQCAQAQHSIASLGAQDACNKMKAGTASEGELKCCKEVLKPCAKWELGCWEKMEDAGKLRLLQRANTSSKSNTADDSSLAASLDASLQDKCAAR